MAAYIPHMIRYRFFLMPNSLMFSADLGRQRVALGLVVASLVIAPSMSALPFTTLWAAAVLLLPRRAT